MQNPTLVLVHGAGHRPEHWQPFADEMKGHGFESIIPDIPTTGSEATLTKGSLIIAAAVMSVEKALVIGHSRGGTSALGMFKYLDDPGSVESLILVNSGGPHNFEPKPNYIGEPALERYSQEFVDSKRYITPDTYVHEPELAKQILYHDAEEDVASWATGLLRAQKEPDTSEIISYEFPESVPLYAVCSQHCRVLNMVRVKRVMAELGIEVNEIPGGHTPQLANPTLLGNKVLRLRNI